jgi:hypothetical protein
MVVKIILTVFKVAIANASFWVPCVADTASFWSALTFASYIIPEKVVWTLDRAADTSAKSFIPNLIISALPFVFTHTVANLAIKEVIG